jgi:hypothetical protein
MAHICIVTSSHIGSNPRVVKEADALTQAGYVVTVVSIDVTPLVRPRDRAVAHEAPWQWIPVKISRWSNGLYLGLRRRFAAASLAAKGISSVGTSVWSHSGYTEPLRRAAARVDADLYIAHNLAALPAAVRVARERRALAGFDAEDFHSGELAPGPDNDQEIRVREHLEQAFLPNCEHATAAAPLIGEAYAGLGSLPMATIRNVFPLSERPTGPADAASDRRGTGASLYWFSQTIGADRGLECAVAALGHMKAMARLHLRGEISDGYRRALLGLAHRHGVADRLHFLPSALPGDMVRLAACHDIGLSLEVPDTPNHDRCLANKIFVYLLAGIPQILSATRAQRALGAELGAAARVLGTADPAELAAQCDALLGDPAALSSARAQALRLGESRFNWDYEKRFLLQEVDRAVGRRARTPVESGGRVGAQHG